MISPIVFIDDLSLIEDFYIRLYDMKFKLDKIWSYNQNHAQRFLPNCFAMHSLPGQDPHFPT